MTRLQATEGDQILRPKGLGSKLDFHLGFSNYKIRKLTITLTGLLGLAGVDIHVKHNAETLKILLSLSSS